MRIQQSAILLTTINDFAPSNLLCNTHRPIFPPFPSKIEPLLLYVNDENGRWHHHHQSFSLSHSCDVDYLCQVNTNVGMISEEKSLAGIS